MNALIYTFRIKLKRLSCLFGKISQLIPQLAIEAITNLKINTPIWTSNNPHLTNFVCGFSIISAWVLGITLRIKFAFVQVQSAYVKLLTLYLRKISLRQVFFWKMEKIAVPTNVTFSEKNDRSLIWTLFWKWFQHGFNAWFQRIVLTQDFNARFSIPAPNIMWFKSRSYLIGYFSIVLCQKRG